MVRQKRRPLSSKHEHEPEFSTWGGTKHSWRDRYGTNTDFPIESYIDCGEYGINGFFSSIIEDIKSGHPTGENYDLIFAAFPKWVKPQLDLNDYVIVLNNVVEFRGYQFLSFNNSDVL